LAPGGEKGTYLMLGVHQRHLIAIFYNQEREREEEKEKREELVSDVSTVSVISFTG
jgi:hypothetical protein